MASIWRVRRVFSMGVAALCTAMALGCTTPSASPARGPGGSLSTDAPRPTSTHAPGDSAGPGPAWTLDAEQAGVVTDGVAITGVRSETADGIQRLIVTFDGSGPPPLTKLDKADAPNRLWLTVSGVRSVSKDLPLLTGEDGRKLSDPVQTYGAPLLSYGRIFYPDDSAIRIELTLDGLRSHRLIAGETPRQVTLQLQR